MNPIDAIEGIARECFWSFGNHPNAHVIDEPEVKGGVTDIDVAFFNGIAMSDVRAEHVPRVVERFRAYGKPFRWWFSPSIQPRNLLDILPGLGFRHVYDSAGMAADLNALPPRAAKPADLAIERVTDLDTLTTFFDIFTKVFARPADETAVWIDAYAHFGFGSDARWSYLLGRIGAVPVATTAILHCGALAGIYHVATLPEWRGRGLAAALTRAAMDEARDSGATHAALQASEMGYGVYLDLGFVEACRLTLYDWRPEGNGP